MIDLMEQRIELLAEVLEKAGHSPVEARELAADFLRQQATIEQGCSWGGVRAEFLPQLWAQASANGNKRRVLLEITAEGDSYDEYFGHLRVEVKAAQSWAEYEQQKTEAREKELN